MGWLAILRLDNLLPGLSIKLGQDDSNFENEVFLDIELLLDIFEILLEFFAI